MDDITPATYARVSTSDQSLDRQTQALASHIEGNYDVDLNDIEFYSDKSTGTNTERDGFRSMMNSAESGEIDVVVVKDMSRLARSLQDLDRVVETLLEYGVTVEFLDESLKYEATEKEDPFQRLQLQLLGAFAEFEARIRKQATREGIAARRQSEEDYHHGPSPLGFDKEDGHLYETEQYPRVCDVLEMVQEGEMSKRKAATELDSSRATVRRSIEDRPELYGIES